MLRERDAVTPPLVDKRSPSTDNVKRDDSALYSLFGCVSELVGPSQQLLTHQVSWNPTSMQTCVESCATSVSPPYIFAGIIRGSECWCDGTDMQSYSAIMSNITTVDQSNCQDTCVEGTEQWCGGASSYQLYYYPTSATVTSGASSSDSVTVAQVSQLATTSATTPESTPATTPASAPATTTTTASITVSVPSTVSTSDNVAYNYLGCYADNTDSASRILRGPTILESSSMTPSICADYCFHEGYPYAGVEYGQECYCGATLFTDPASTADGCTQPCSGDNSQACGAQLRIEIYSLADSTLIDEPTPTPASSSGQWTTRGCYIDDVDTRTLPVPLAIDPSVFSVDSCTTACGAAGYTVAGLEYGNECYCGYEVPEQQADAHDCDIVCPTGPGTCGGLLRLDVYSSA